MIQALVATAPRAKAPGTSTKRGRRNGLTTILLLTAASLLAPAVSSAQVVQRVIDGDTIIVDGIGRVRLIGVDTPESVDPRRPVEYFAKEAARFTQQLVEGKRVRLEYDGPRTDRYDRTLAYVFLEDGTLVNAEIIRQGYGFAYTAFPFRYLDQFRRLEREARESGRGLWADASSSAVVPAPRPSQPRSVDPATIVYVTRTGDRYHRDGCRYLARSQIAMPLAEAARRYSPCSVCRPPVP